MPVPATLTALNFTCLYRVNATCPMTPQQGKQYWLRNTLVSVAASRNGGHRFVCCQNCEADQILEKILPCTKWLKLYRWKDFLLVRLCQLEP